MHFIGHLLAVHHCRLVSMNNEHLCGRLWSSIYKRPSERMRVHQSEYNIVKQNKVLNLHLQTIKLLWEQQLRKHYHLLSPRTFLRALLRNFFPFNSPSKLVLVLSNTKLQWCTIIWWQLHVTMQICIYQFLHHPHQLLPKGVCSNDWESRGVRIRSQRARRTSQGVQQRHRTVVREELPYILSRCRTRVKRLKRRP